MSLYRFCKDNIAVNNNYIYEALIKRFNFLFSAYGIGR